MHPGVRPQGPAGPARSAFAVVAAAAGLASFAQLGAPGAYGSDEHYYLGAALTAIESRQYLIPIYDGHARLEKPPLQYWLIEASYRLFGVGLWQGRLPSATAAVISVLLTAWLAGRLFASRRAALYAAGILAASGLFLVQAHVAITDAVLCCFVLGAFAGFAVAGQGRRAGARLAWVCMAGAFLQKGPVGIALPLGSALVWRWLAPERRLGWRSIFDPLGVALFLALALPWPLLAISRLGAADLGGPIGDEVGMHLRPPLSQLPKKLFSYAWDLIRSVLPWTPALLAYRQRELRSSEIRWLGLWVGGFALVFSFFVLKHRWRYLVPAIPAMALLAGRALDLLQERQSERGFDLRLCLLAVEAWFVAAVVQGVLLYWSARGPLDGTSAPMVAALAAACAAASGALVPLLERRASPHVWVIAALLGIVLVQTLRSVSFLATVPTVPAWELARLHLRDRAAPTRVVGLGLAPEEQSWASVGAGFSFPRESATDAAWSRVEPGAFVLADRSSAEAMPAALRTDFREVARFDGIDTHGGLAWRRGHLNLRREPGRSSLRARSLVLLRRLPGDASGPLLR